VRFRSRSRAIVTTLALVAAILVVPTPADAHAGGDVYVSTLGSDHGPGTWWWPVRTLEKARDLVRARTRDQRADLTVHVASGVYRLSRPLVLDVRDSGGNGHRVTWEGAADTVISGGRQVTGWRPVHGKPGLWSAPAPRGLDNTRQLYVNGVRAQRARGPMPVTLTATPTGYTASADTIAHWRNPTDVEFVYTAGEAMWNLQRYGLGQWTEPR